MTRVVVAAALDLTGPHRQEGLCPIQRLDLGLLVDAKHQRPVGRAEIEPDDIADFLDEQGIGESLKVSLRWGYRPKVCRMRGIFEGA